MLILYTFTRIYTIYYEHYYEMGMTQACSIWAFCLTDVPPLKREKQKREAVHHLHHLK